MIEVKIFKKSSTKKSVKLVRMLFHDVTHLRVVKPRHYPLTNGALSFLFYLSK